MDVDAIRRAIEKNVNHRDRGTAEGVESPAAGLSHHAGEVLSCEDVPETHLHVCQVVGEEEARQIVCGVIQRASRHQA